MFAGNRTSAGTNAAHEQHARAVAVFQVINIGLETRRISHANARACTGLGRYDNAGCVAIGVDRARMLSGGDRSSDSRTALAKARLRRLRGQGRAMTIIVTRCRRRANLMAMLPSFCWQNCEYTKGDECGDLHALLLARPPP